MNSPIRHRGLHRYAIFLTAWAVVLIKWGAAVTTENAGMAFPDWPLSNGSLNPEGWLRVQPFLLEHGHRLLGAGLGLLSIGLVIWTLVIPQTRLLRILAGVVLAAVILQGLMGGLRVLRVSDAFAIFHGCFAQAFFCLLLLVVLMTSARWEEDRPMVRDRSRIVLRRWAWLLLGVLFVQLFLGASTRHLHRIGVAATDYPLTNGQWIPSFEYGEVAFHFLHRWWAFAVLAVSVGFSEWVRKLDGDGVFRRYAFGVTGLLALQVLLGIATVLTATPDSKNFWITNAHVLNGLAVLGVTFVLFVKAWRSVPRGPLLVPPETGGIRTSPGEAAGSTVA